MRRILAAVMAADIEGYSRLMGADAEMILDALRRMRAEVFNPAVAANQGRVVKSMGDGWIVLFPAITDAANAAIQIQDRMSRWEGDPQLRLRIGLHTGDIVEEEDDVFGDGVNVAARLEQFAKPSAVAVSEALHGGLDGVLRVAFDAVGETPNIGARLEALAEPGSVLVSDSTRQLCGEVFELQACGPLTLIRYQGLGQCLPGIAGEIC